MTVKVLKIIINESEIRALSRIDEKRNTLFGAFYSLLLNYYNILVKTCQEIIFCFFV